MNTEIVKKNEYGIEPSKAEELTSGLTVTLEERKGLILEFETISKLDLVKENRRAFRDLRLKIAKNRTAGISVWHKANKAFFLAGGRFIDSIKNRECQINETMELKLNEAEDHFLEQDRQAKDTLQKQRENEIDPFLPYAWERDLSAMSEKEWKLFFDNTKQTFEENEKIEAEAEKERIEKIEADKIEAKRIAEVNKKLIEAAQAKQKEAEEKLEKERKETKDREAKAKKESDKIEALRLEEKASKDAKEKTEREALELKLKVADDKVKRIEREAKEKSDKIQAELDEKKRLEELALEEIEADKQRKLQQSDNENLEELECDLLKLQTKYRFKSKQNQERYKKVCIHLESAYQSAIGKDEKQE